MVGASRLHALVAAALLPCLTVCRAGAVSSGPSPASQSATVTVRAEPVAGRYLAYAEVQPIAPLPVRAMEPGVVTALRALRGSQVRAGQPLAALAGPEIQSLLASREAALDSARAQLSAARQLLAIRRRQLKSQMSTRQSVTAAQSALAAATAAFATARGQLRVARQMSMLRAPSSGTVLAVSAADGERVAAGDTILTLQPRGRLWLTASYYGRDTRAIHVGMSGVFQPAGAGSPIRVKVLTLAASLGPDGGEMVGMAPAASTVRGTGVPPAAWLNGERGTVALVGPTRMMIAVPTSALILDHAQWWVLVHTTRGDRPRQVVPGPTRGWQTFIEHGLQPGDRVVVQDAYLEFYRGVARLYSPPD